MTTTESAPARDEAQLRQLIADQMSAICAKDLDRLMNHYAADVVVFDAKPPFQTQGAAAWRRTWEACLSCFPDSFQTEMRDRSVTISGDLRSSLMDWVLFIDDGGVMNDNALRGSQWQRLLGEFFPPILGGTPEAWAEANRIVAPRLWQGYGLYGPADVDYAAYDRAYRTAWLGGMCEWVDVRVPPEEECITLAHRAAAYVTRRVRSAYPGAIAAIRHLHNSGYRLHTASGECSAELAGYLEGMGVRHCFQRLYGPDLVNTLKEGIEYYARIFADAGVAPDEALVVEDNPLALRWAAQAGARTVLVDSAGNPEAPAEAVIGSLAELPQVIERLE